MFDSEYFTRLFAIEIFSKFSPVSGYAERGVFTSVDFLSKSIIFFVFRRSFVLLIDGLGF